MLLLVLVTLLTTRCVKKLSFWHLLLVSTIFLSQRKSILTEADFNFDFKSLSPKTEAHVKKLFDEKINNLVSSSSPAGLPEQKGRRRTRKRFFILVAEI